MSLTHPRQLRGKLEAECKIYGHSVLGAPLLWFPAPVADQHSGLILAGTHGDETASVVTLSCAIRTLHKFHRRHHVVLAVNPDGCQLGLPVITAELPAISADESSEKYLTAMVDLLRWQPSSSAHG
ncbi:hypothetical protein EH228_00965 [Erwinia endophytica]|nr:hypothetical protein [Erwinia endophytica]KAB8313648.1 hypothetical protein EH228_00965 [Erwinia endophytica]